MANPDLLALEETSFLKNHVYMDSHFFTGYAANGKPRESFTGWLEANVLESNHGKLPASHNHLAHHLFNG